MNKFIKTSVLSISIAMLAQPSYASLKIEDELSEKELTPTDINRIVNELREETHNDIRYKPDHIDPIHSTLRRFGYDELLLTNPLRYAYNLQTLGKEIVQIQLQKTMQDLVKDKLSDKEYNSKELGIISELFYYREYEELLKEQCDMYDGGYKKWGRTY